MIATALRDVTLRDGLQDEAPVHTETKVALFEALVAAGITDLELTSFVRPDRVPAMADAEALCDATKERGITRWGLVLNPRGAQRALSAGLSHLQYVVSVSDSHSRRNAGIGTVGAMAGLDQVVQIGAARGAAVEVTLATAFGCPEEGPVDVGRVVTLAAQSACRVSAWRTPSASPCPQRCDRCSVPCAAPSTFRSGSTSMTPAASASPTPWLLSMPASTASTGQWVASAGVRLPPAPRATWPSRTSFTPSTR
jgi:hypothetical protein